MEEVFKNKSDIFFAALDAPREKDHEVDKIILNGVEQIKKGNVNLTTADILNNFTTSVLNGFSVALNPTLT
jgi:hypothetical protein